MKFNDADTKASKQAIEARIKAVRARLRMQARALGEDDIQRLASLRVGRRKA